MSRKQLKHAAVAITLILAAAVSTPNPAWAAPIPANTASIKTAASAPISAVYYRRGFYGRGRGFYGRGFYGRGYYGRGYYGRGYYRRPYVYPYGAYGYSYPYYSYPYAYPYLGFGFGWGGW